MELIYLSVLSIYYLLPLFYLLPVHRQFVHHSALLHTIIHVVVSVLAAESNLIKVSDLGLKRLKCFSELRHGEQMKQCLRLKTSPDPDPTQVEEQSGLLA